jgi:chromate transporter
MRESLSLFYSFFKIGLFTFGGGYAMIPLVQREVVRKGWILEDQFLELLTLAQSAPGPLALNTAVFVGYRVKGYRGVALSVFGIILPSFVIILIIAIYLHSFRDNHVVAAVFKGIRPAVVALMLAPVFGFSKGLGWKRGVLAVVAAFLVWYFSISPVYLIIFGALGGIAWGWWRLRRELEKTGQKPTAPGSVQDIDSVQSVNTADAEVPLIENPTDSPKKSSAKPNC